MPGNSSNRRCQIAGVVARFALDTLGAPRLIVLAIDDTVTKRFGPCVQGAGKHRNPTPGPAGAKYAYGHVWVTLAIVARHAWWGTIGLPLLGLMYIRKQDLAKIDPPNRPDFATKMTLAGQLIGWAVACMDVAGREFWAVVDGGYTRASFLVPTRVRGVHVICRLRKDAQLFDQPPARKAGDRGRPRVYGDRISLAGRAAHPGGWQSGEFNLYGKAVIKQYKTFLAIYKPAGGLVRVLLVKEDDGSWRAWASTQPDADAQFILERVSDRGAIEQVFHDIKETHGAGQQQTRNLFANIGVYNMLLWLHTLIELWAWNLPAARLIDRSQRPWDNQPRRPSHTDRRNALRREILRQTFLPGRIPRPTIKKLKSLLRGLMTLAT